MPDQPKYEDHESQPGHRPGMESVVNRNPDGTKQVSPPTQSAFGAASRSDPPPKAPAAPAKPTATAPPAATPPPSADEPYAGPGGRARTQKVLQQADDMS